METSTFIISIEISGLFAAATAGKPIVPTGAYDHFTVDARFTYRPVFDDELVPSAGLTVGYEL